MSDDNGSIDKDNESHEEEEVPPKKKAASSSSNKRSASSTVKEKHDGSSKKQKSTVEEKAEGSSTKKTGTGKVTNDDGTEMYELGNNRFVSVSEFKGKKLVNIREYYQKDDKLAPGKKGISLSRDQYINLKKMIKVIDENIEA